MRYIGCTNWGNLHESKGIGCRHSQCIASNWITPGTLCGEDIELGALSPFDYHIYLSNPHGHVGDRQGAGVWLCTSNVPEGVTEERCIRG